VGTIQHTPRCVSGDVSPGGEWLRDGFDISFTTSVEAQNVRGSTAGLFYVFMEWWLINLKDDSLSANEPPRRSPKYCAS
jgi:hypothetical protein